MLGHYNPLEMGIIISKDNIIYVLYIGANNDLGYCYSQSKRVVISGG